MRLLSRALVVVGLALLVPSGVWLLGGMMGLLQTDFMAVGSSSGLRTIAALAVLGCLLAATGYWKQEQEHNK